MRIVPLIIILLVLASCAANPRYRTGGQERLASIPQDSTDTTTNENLRLGKIMRSFLGKPYKGRSKYDPGLDCSKFTREVFKRYNGLQLPRTAAEQFKHGKEAARHRLVFGDLIFFNTNGRGISHVGIYTGDDQFIHVSSSRGVIVSSLKEKYWSKRYLGARHVLK
ncbi:MAG: C40 family peptidase [Candidatus Zixiibacteriota bacterium]